MSTFQLSLADSDQDYVACFDVMHELRPHLRDAASFAAQARRHSEQGYRLLAARQGHDVMGVAGYRIQENLIYGRFLYVDDLVATARARSQGLGGVLIEALRESAGQQDCAARYRPWKRPGAALLFPPRLAFQRTSFRPGAIRLNRP